MSVPTPERADDYIPLIPALVLMGAVTLLLLALFTANPSTREGAEPFAEATVEPTVVAVEPTVEQPAITQPDPAMVRAGDTIFQTVCSACHGFTGRGIPGLGKTLVGSEFVDGMTDAELVAFITVGREVIDPLNTTGVPMPAKGGNPMLSESDLYNVVAYIRNLNIQANAAASAPAQPTAVPAQPTVAPVEPTPAPVEPTVVAAAPTTAPEAAPAEPEAVTFAPPLSEAFLAPGRLPYERACASCHASGGEGANMLAQSLNTSTLLQARDGMGLFTFLTTDVPPAFGVMPHPVRGGYPDVTDAQILDIIAYMYSLPAVQARQ
jgi:disulfide bond formation protein DsbB